MLIIFILFAMFALAYLNSARFARKKLTLRNYIIAVFLGFMCTYSLVIRGTTTFGSIMAIYCAIMFTKPAIDSLDSVNEMMGRKGKYVKREAS